MDQKTKDILARVPDAVEAERIKLQMEAKNIEFDVNTVSASIQRSVTNIHQLNLVINVGHGERVCEIGMHRASWKLLAAHFDDEEFNKPVGWQPAKLLTLRKKNGST